MFMPPALITVLGGRARRTADGTWNVWAETGAEQMKIPPRAGDVWMDAPVIWAYVFASPPVQLTSTPCVRWIVEILSMFDHTSGAASEICAVKAPTSGPPLP